MSSSLPRVAVIANSAPSLAFLRSLGRHGVDIVVPAAKTDGAARWSRYGRREDVEKLDTVDTTVEWIHDAVSSGRVDFVAPTSDLVAYALAVVETDLGRQIGLPGEPEKTIDCLFKARFDPACAAAGVPVPPTLYPQTFDQVAHAVEELGYPAVIKPRSHVGLGGWRGRSVHGPADLHLMQQRMRRDVESCSALDVDPYLRIPMVQSFLTGPTRRIVSVSGYLSRAGDFQAISHCQRTREWGSTGTGSEFTAIDGEAHTEPALDLVRKVLGAGIFELELIVDDATGECWALDLNPRGFGQMRLDIARGHDLPVLWLNDLAGCDLPLPPRPEKPPRTWRDGTIYYTDLLLGCVVGRGASRFANLRRLLRSPFESHVGAAWDRRDPIPGVLWVGDIVRHPGGLIKPLVRQHRQRD